MLHVGEVNKYHPPTHVSKHLIAHAIRNIPNSNVLLQKMYPKKDNLLGPLKPHQYNNTGQLQFAFY